MIRPWLVVFSLLLLVFWLPFVAWATILDSLNPGGRPRSS